MPDGRLRQAGRSGRPKLTWATSNSTVTLSDAASRSGARRAAVLDGDLGRSCCGFRRAEMFVLYPLWPARPGTCPRWLRCNVALLTTSRSGRCGGCTRRDRLEWLTR